MNVIDLYQAELERLNGAAPAWLRQLRAQGFERFASLGFPSTRLEDWKYTNVGPLTETAFRRPVQSSVSDEQAVRAALLGLPCELVFVNARYAPQLSALQAAQPDARVGNLASLLGREPELLERHLGRIAAFDARSFVALNAAFLQDGAVVIVPAGVTVSEPIHLLFWSEPTPEPTLCSTRNLVVLEERASATVIETYVSASAHKYLTNTVTEISVGPGAALTHYRLQQEGDDAFHVATVEAVQHASSRFVSHVVSLGGSLVRADVNTTLAGEGAQCRFDGLYVAGGRQQVDHHTCIDHQQGGCTSRELYKGVLQGHATGVFNGKVFVRPNAQKSDAGQVNKNLLLSDAATINTKPQLEIFADDVKCNHGATIGRLDLEALFYLRARGIEEHTARALLVHGFMNELITRMSVGAVRERLEQTLLAQFGEGLQVEELA
jgi:Fe-S cluster assembly protein SufD